MKGCETLLRRLDHKSSCPLANKQLTEENTKIIKEFLTYQYEYFKDQL